MHYAANNDRLAVVQFLISHGANVNALTHNKQTPLQLAASNNHQAVVDFLRSHGGH